MIIALLMVPTLQAEAGTYANYGIGIFHANDYNSAAVKSFSVGHNEQLFGPVIYQYEGGYFGDSSGHGREPSGFGSGELGVEADPGYFVLRSLWGVGFITTPDAMLGGPVQFNQDFLIGVKGNNGAIIGLDYKHMSSAGLERPNLGRDFILIHVELPF